MDTIETIKNKLSILEDRLQTIVEGGALRLFGADGNQGDLVKRLVAAMQAGIQIPEGSQAIAPNLFVLFVHPSRADVFQNQESLLDKLSQALEETASQASLSFLGPPLIRIVEDVDLLPFQVDVVAQISSEKLAQTSDMPGETPGSAGVFPSNAYLVVNGLQVFPLDQSVINIGRRPDNHLVIDDPRISRIHAQLRSIKNRFVIFDLDSTGGTFVNGQRIRQGYLFPGDVISLSGVPLVYSQDSELGETQKYVPPTEQEETS